MAAMAAMFYFRNDCNFESNHAHVLPYHPVKFEVDR
jgi:hypothetical protein